VLVLFSTGSIIVAMGFGFSLPSTAYCEGEESPQRVCRHESVNKKPGSVAGKRQETSTDGHAPRTSWHGWTGELQDADAVADAGQGIQASP